MIVVRQSDETLLQVKKVRTAWELFISGEERGLDHVRPEIRDSWVRSQQLGVSPLIKQALVTIDQEEFDRRCQQNKDFVEAGRLIITSLAKSLTTDLFVIGISDNVGIVLCLHASPRAIPYIEAFKGLPSTNCAEASMGTNSAGVALHLNKPAQVHWFEHYTAFQHEWAGCSAPIHSPSGALIGCIGMTAFHNEITHPRALDLIIDTAQTIEGRLNAQEAVRRASMLDAFSHHLLRYPDEILLALDRHGQILAASPTVTRLFSSFPPDSLIGRHLTAITDLRLQQSLDAVLHQSQALSIRFGHREEVREGTILPVQTAAGQVGALLRIASRRPTPPRHSAVQSWSSTYTFSDLIGQAPAFRHALDFACKAAGWDKPILLVGESGTGKELFAQAIHRASPTARGPFVALNCSTIPRELATTELFGYEEGTFTGARRSGRKGKIELAAGGTLFLDEIGDLPLAVQPTMLRFLEDGQILPLGSEHTRRVAVRVVTAAGPGLAQAVANGAFRLDLYHRLSFFPITLPPLRERLEDLPLLARHFLDTEGFSHIQLSAPALALLLRHSWPGNVRELRNVIVRAAMLAAGVTLTPEDLVLEPTNVPLVSPARRPPPTLEEIQRELEACAGNASQASRNLGIHRVTLYRRLRAE